MSVSLFLGAGASLEFDVPLFMTMAKNFVKEERYNKYTDKIQEINNDFKSAGFKPNIENYISYAEGRKNPKKILRNMNPFVSHFVKNSNCSKLGYDPQSRYFIHDLEDYVYENLHIQEEDRRLKILAFYDRFFEHINNLYFADRDFEIDIFTTNYDNIIEEYSEKKGLSVFDGYDEKPDGISYYSPHLYKEKVDQIRLYKIHGSVNISIVENIINNKKHIVHVKRRLKIGEIYKDNLRLYERIMLLGYNKEITREPYFDLLQLLKNNLMSVFRFIVIGYSFEDNQILSIFKDVLSKRNDDFKIIILGPNAIKIKRDIFNNDDKIEHLNCEFKNFHYIGR